MRFFVIKRKFKTLLRELHVFSVRLKKLWRNGMHFPRIHRKEHNQLNAAQIKRLSAVLEQIGVQ